MFLLKNIRWLLLLRMIVVSAILSGQTTLKKIVISNGGQQISNASYRMNLTIGQALAANLQSEKNDAHIGFWYEVKSSSLKPFKLEKYVQSNGIKIKPVNRGNGLIIYPNPFYDQAKIEFELNEHGMTRLSLIDVQGREIDVLMNEVMEQGKYKISYQPRYKVPGMYTLLLTSGTDQVHKSCMILQ